MAANRAEQKLAQHGNDIDEIYGMLTGIQSTLKNHDERFDGLERQMGEVLGLLRDRSV